ncbi:MAG: LysM peptidoglycan-binding domain-containing protein [Christensenellales bacterium]
MNIKILNYKPTKNVFYRVQQNDTLETIAEDFGITKSYILQNNKHCLYEGQVLFLPETNLTTYVVKPFDTLQKIASAYGKTPDDIKKKNNMNSDYIFVGQKLFL